MPSHRGERWIDQALTSLVAARTDGVEVVIVDGSPTPATLDRARGFADRLRLQLHHRPDLASWHNKTNFGVERAGAAHICWLGVDDVWLDDRASVIRTWLNEATDIALHLAPAAIVDCRTRRLGLWRCPLPTLGRLSASQVTERLLVQNFIAAPAPVFTKRAYLSCGGLDERLWYTADWDLWLKLAALGQTRYHPEVTVGFRIHDESLTMTGSRDSADLSRQMLTVLERHLPSVEDDRGRIERAARVSIRLNAALAAASRGALRSIPTALFELLCLGPGGMRRYFRDSRIVERLVPRVRAMLANTL